MSGCSDTCQPPVVTADATVTLAAEKLACLLVDTPEFQTFVQSARTVNLDQQVSELVQAINARRMEYAFRADDSAPVEALHAQLEALPVIQEYRAAESAVRELFNAVDGLISQQAGVEFAVNARAACG